MFEFLTPPFILSILIALSFHEWAHGFVAYKLGDPTAKYQGRLTLNPIAHLDPIGTVMFLLVGFGWGKPVPIDPRYFKKYRRDTALVSIAGPLSNLLLAIVVFILLLIFFPSALSGSPTALLSGGAGQGLQSFLIEFLQDSLYLNLGLMAFNLLPIAPLDGSKILLPFIPLKYDEAYERFMRNGPWILLGLLVLGRAFNVPVLTAWIYLIISPVLTLMTWIANAIL